MGEETESIVHITLESTTKINNGITSAKYNTDTATIELTGTACSGGWVTVDFIGSIVRPRWVRKPHVVRAKKFNLNFEISNKAYIFGV